MRTVQINENIISTVSPALVGEFIPQNWRHRITATIGFDTASFDIQASHQILEEMYYEGCGRRVTRYSRDGNSVVWDGFIAEMTLNQPGSQKTISLREMANGIIVRYMPIDTTTNPPTEGAEAWTTPVDNAASQNKYGIKQRVFVPPKVNRLTAVDAAQYGNTLLAYYNQPLRTERIANGSEPGLSISCQGYGHTLDWHTYIQNSVSGTDNASTIIDTVVQVVDQDFIASRDIDTNTTAVQKYFNRFDTGLEIVQTIAALGDGSYNRWLAYVLEDRIFKYKQASNSVDYYRRLSDPYQHIYGREDGRIIPYYLVRPNAWIRTVDSARFLLPSTTLRDDLQTMFIETVEWSEPDTLTLSGVVGDQLQVIVARMANRGDALL